MSIFLTTELLINIGAEVVELDVKPLCLISLMLYFHKLPTAEDSNSCQQKEKVYMNILEGRFSSKMTLHSLENIRSYPILQCEHAHVMSSMADVAILRLIW